MKLEVVVIPVADADRVEGVLHAARVAARCRLRVRQRLPRRPVHAARLGRLDPVRHEDHDGAARARLGACTWSSRTSRRRAPSSPARGVEISEVFHPGAPGAQFAQDGADRVERARARARDATAPSRRSATPTATNGCCRRSHSGFPAASTPPRPRSRRRPIWPDAMRRASVAHGEHEKRMGGEYDANWPDWYAAYMVAEQARDRAADVSADTRTRRRS